MSPTATTEAQRADYLRRDATLKELFQRICLHSTNNKQYNNIPLDPALRLDAQLALESLAHKIDKQEIRVAIVALVKAGKSTINNTTLHGNFLHVNVVPATSGICYISHGSEAVLTNNANIVIARGAENIFNKIQEVNERLRAASQVSSPNQSATQNQNQNQNKLDGDELHLTAPIGALSGFDKVLTDRIQFVDTPGRDEAANNNVRLLVDKLISSSDVLVFVFNYTMLKTSSESEMWTRLMMLRPELLYSERMYYIINKFDQKGTHGITEQETIDYVSQNVLKYVGYKPDASKIFVMSAKRAFDARMMLDGKVQQGSKYAAAMLEDYFPGQDAEFEQLCAINWKSVLQKSKFLDYETKVLKHLVEKSFPLLVDSQQNDLDRYARTMQKALQDTINQVGKSIDALNQEMSHLSLIQGEVEKFAAQRLPGFYETFKRTALNRFFDETARVLASLASSKSTPEKFSINNGNIQQAQDAASAYALDQANKLIGMLLINLRATVTQLESGVKGIIDRTEHDFKELFKTELVPLVTEAAKKYDIKGALVLPPLPPGDITSGVLEFIHQLTTMDYDALKQNVASLVSKGTETVQKLENSTTEVTVEVREPKVGKSSGFHISVGPFSIGNSKPSVTYETRQEKRSVPTVVARNIEQACFFVSPSVCEQAALTLVAQALAEAKQNSLKVIPQLLDTQVKDVWGDLVKAPITTVIASTKAVLQMKSNNAANENAIKDDVQKMVQFFSTVVADLQGLNN